MLVDDKDLWMINFIVKSIYIFMQRLNQQFTCHDKYSKMCDLILDAKHLYKLLSPLILLPSPPDTPSTPFQLPFPHNLLR